MIKSILLSVDGSIYTESVLKYGIHLAKTFDARLKVITIVDIRFVEWAVAMGTDGFVPIIPSTVYQEESRKILEAKAEAVIQKSIEILQKEQVEFGTEKIVGSPVDIIIEQSHLVDLLILGARGEFARWQSKLVGATLEAVVRQCNKPILIVNKDFRPLKKLLVAYDGSEKANKALQMAGFFAAKLQRPVLVLTVHDNEQIRNKYLQEAKTYLDSYEIAVTLKGTEGSPEKEILTIAQSDRCDIIIMGAFGHSRIREAILGSITEHVMRHATLPVLLVK